MIAILVELTIRPGEAEAFERAFADQAAAVYANEPGNLAYTLLRSQSLADTYTLVEFYADEGSLTFHQSSPHMAVHRPLTAAFLSTSPLVHRYVESTSVTT